MTGRADGSRRDQRTGRAPSRLRQHVHGHVAAAWGNVGFRQLLAVRLAGQFGDGVFTAGLAGAVLFNPERQAQPAQIAAGFAVLLLPYSVIGPFAGVLLDRWRRQRVLTRVNVARAAFTLLAAGEIAAGFNGIGFYASALVVFSASRFLLSALGAGLPHVVERSELVTANALSTTAGAVTAAIGGACALAVKSLLGSSPGDYAVVAAAAAVPYLVGAALAVAIQADALGPDAVERGTRKTASAVLRGLQSGARAVGAVSSVRNGLAVIAVHRICYGITLVCTLLLYRNYLSPDGIFRTGLAGLSQVVAAIAIGGGAAAVCTPVAFRQLGPVRWPVWLLIAAAIFQVTLVLPFRVPLLLVATLLLGFIAQSIKLTVDTLVQQGIGDAFRGRVFALYDMLFNVALVLAATFTAVVLPPNGHSTVTMLLVAVGYVLAAAAYAISGSCAAAPPDTPRNAQDRGRSVSGSARTKPAAH